MSTALHLKIFNRLHPYTYCSSPKKPIINLAHLSEGDQTLMGHMMMMASKIAADAGIEESFRLITNTGASAGQTVFHLHFHIIGGKNMGALLAE